MVAVLPILVVAYLCQMSLGHTVRRCPARVLMQCRLLSFAPSLCSIHLDSLTRPASQMHDLTYIRERQMDKMSAMALRWMSGVTCLCLHRLGRRIKS